MTKIRKNFNLDEETVKKAEMMAISSKRSLTQFIEFLICEKADKDEKELFDYLDERGKDC